MINFLTYGFMGLGIGMTGGIIICIITALFRRWYKKNIKKEDVTSQFTILNNLIYASHAVWDQIVYNRSYIEEKETNKILEYVHQLGLTHISSPYIKFIIENPNMFKTESLVLNWLIIQELQIKQQDVTIRQHDILH